MKWSVRLVVALLLLATPAAAQVRGLPVVNNGIGRGTSLGADIGFANDEAGGGTALGARASLGMGVVGISGSISLSDGSDGKEIWAPGAALSVRIFGGPLVPFRVTALAGFSQWDEGVVSVWHVPLSLSLSATIPNPAFAIRPWIAPRLSIHRASLADVSESESSFALSGGIDLGFLNGMVVRAAYDRVSRDGITPSIFSLGLGFAVGR